MLNTRAEFNDGQYSGVSIAERFFYASMLCMGLNFRQDLGEGVSWIQYALFGGAILSAFLAALSDQSVRRILQTPLHLALIAYVSYIGIRGLFVQGGSSHYTGWLAPYITLIAGFWLGALVVSRRGRTNALYSGILVVGVMSVVFRYVYARQTLGLDIDVMRWQAGSPFHSIIVVVAVPLLLFREKIPWLAAVALAVWAGSSFLQVTRSLLLGVAVLAAFHIAAAIWNHRFAATAIVVRRLGLVAIVAFISGAVALATHPEITELWTKRVFEEKSSSGMTLTLMTRYYEWFGVVEGFGSDLSKWTFGTGIGSIHHDSLSILEEEGVTNSNQLTVGTDNPVHSVIFNSLKTGGIVGLIVFGCILFQLSKRAFRLGFKMRLSPTDVRIVYAMGFINTLLAFSYVDPFFHREGAYLFGLFSGAVYYATIPQGGPRLPRVK